MVVRWHLHKNFQSLILLKPLIFQDVFLAPKVAPLIIQQLCERLEQEAQGWMDVVVCAGLGQVSGWEE